MSTIPPKTTAGVRWIRRLRRVNFAVPAAIGLLVFGAISIHFSYRQWVGLNDREPLLAGLRSGGAQSLATPPPRVARRVVLVVADGLNAALFDKLPTLRDIGRSGVRAHARAAGPTFSTPSYATWLTGVDPEDSGARTNEYRGPMPIDSIAARAKAGGLRAIGYDETSDDIIRNLVGPFLDAHWAGLRYFERALAALSSAELAIFALDGVDHAGHSHGPDSETYRREALALDDQVRRIRQRLDPKRDLIAVVNDHGHLPGSGGHGGLEPAVRRLALVAAGAGLARGVGPRRISQNDLAPTLALLLGVSPPGHNRGWPMLWALGDQADERFRRAAFSAHLHSRLRVERHLAQSLDAPSRVAAGVGLGVLDELLGARLGSLRAAQRLARGIIRGIKGRIGVRKADRLFDHRARRGFIAGLAVLLVLALIIAAERLGVIRIDAVGIGVGLLLPPVMFASVQVVQVPLTLSFPADALVTSLLVTGALLVVGVLAATLTVATARGHDGLRLGRIAVSVWGLLVCAATVTALTPAPTSAALPDLRLISMAMFARYSLALFCTCAAVALLASRFGRRRLGTVIPVT